MERSGLLQVLLVCFVFIACVYTSAPISGFRPPAVPLITNDPYFSVWQQSDNLTDTWATLWDGTIKGFSGLIRIDTVPYRFMGSVNVPPMQQMSVVVYPTRTVYVFAEAGIQLTVTFTTPIIPDSFDLLSRPVTYLSLDVESYDGKSHSVQLYYDNSGEIAVNTIDEQIVWERQTTPKGLVTMRIGTSAQNVLGQTGDFIGIDWGYMYVATANQSGLSQSMNAADTTRNSFVINGVLPADNNNQPVACNDNWPVLSLMWDLGTVSSDPQQRLLVLAYDDVASMNFFGTNFKAYWTTLYSDILVLIDQSWVDFSALSAQAESFDASLLQRLSAAGNDQYATLCSISYRQTMAGTKLVWNSLNNTVWYFMKEISSDGDVSTVDVIFPASPLFLYFNASLLTLQLLPIFAYANNETNHPYTLPWAPHHLGQWPVADIYTSEQENMPIEETGNLILMIAAIVKQTGDNPFAKIPPYWSLIESWAQYLVDNLPDPGNQLCTDDFEGPTPHDANLAVKGILAIGAYSYMCDQLGNTSAATQFMSIATSYAKQWMVLANPNNTDYYRLRYDQDGWSLKYNMLFQYILDLDVFPPSVMQTELSFYMTKLNEYGIPLDVRSDFSKLDWQSWIAAMADDSDFDQIFNALYLFAQNTPNRLPLTDWYYTSTAVHTGFQARTVVGGLYAKALLEEQSLAKPHRPVSSVQISQ